MDDDLYADFDVKGAVASIGSDLFPAKSGTEPNTPSVPADGGDLGAAPSQSSQQPAEKDPNAPEPTIVPGQNSANPNPAATTVAPMPKSWKKDMEPHWGKLPPEVHAYVQEREAQVMRGIQQYKGGHDLWSQLVEPFIPIFQQHPDVNPVQLMQGLLQTHLTLVDPRGDPAKKAELAGLLLSQYGIPVTGQQTDAAVLQRLQRAEQKNAEFERRWNTYENQQKEEIYKKNLALVDAFLADPKNKYVEEVHNDIMHLVKTGAADGLPAAYEMACWANPVVRQKMLADQQSPAPGKNGQPARGPNGQFVNLDGTEVRPIKVKPTSMDDTINGVVSKHYPKH